MTYARSRLWLGITAVGTLQVLAILLLLTGFHLEVPHDFGFRCDSVRFTASGM